MPNTIRSSTRSLPQFSSPRNRIRKQLADTLMPGEPRHVLFIVSTFHSHGVNQPIKCVSLDREHVRQMEIERLRAERQSDFERIDSMTPDLDELLSMTIEPPREWLDER